MLRKHWSGMIFIYICAFAHRFDIILVWHMIWFMYKSQVVSHFDSPLFFFSFFRIGSNEPRRWWLWLWPSCWILLRDSRFWTPTCILHSRANCAVNSGCLWMINGWIFVCQIGSYVFVGFSQSRTAERLRVALANCGSFTTCASLLCSWQFVLDTLNEILCSILL